jgi:deazaflavin-dependent oxidoreductase (nitroreductase family)
MYYGVLHHVGRRSGAAYDTPVVAKVTPRGVLIPLPYGPDTDWCRNVLAAGSCGLTLKGAEYALHSPEIVAATIAEPLLPSVNARIWHTTGITSYLLLKVRAPVDLPAHEAVLAPR